MEVVKQYKKLFSDIKFNKTLKDNELKKEFYQLKKDYQRLSQYKEDKQNKYLKKFVMFHEVKGIFSMKEDLKLRQKQYKNLTFLRTLELKRITEKEKLTPYIITLTLPTEYHPFKVENPKEMNKDLRIYSLNENFIFKNIDTRLKNGYIELNNIYREFYKLIKNEVKKDLKFMKIIEPHATLVPHLHAIIFFKDKEYLTLLKHFENVVKKHNLIKVEFVPLESNVNYVIKYILKNFSDEELRTLDGWKKQNKIRLFTMSNLTLNSTIFKKLYFNNPQLNKEKLKEIKEEKTEYKNLYHFYTNNTNVNKIYINKDDEVIKENQINEFGEFINLKNDNKLFNITQIIKIDKVQRNYKKTNTKEIITINKNDLKKKLIEKDFSFRIIEKRKILKFNYYKLEINRKRTFTKKMNINVLKEFEIEKENEVIYNKSDFKKLLVSDYEKTLKK